MQYRQFGNTGLKVSVIGFSGIVATGMAQDDVDRAVASAIDRGVNYFDFAPGYGDCEERLGPALVGRREGLVLACKTAERTKDKAREQLERSLTRFATDHFDIYQLHGVPNREELETALGPGGAMEAILEAKERGMVHHIGITLHSEELALEAFDRFAFDSVLFPINFINWYKRGEGEKVLAEAASRGIGRAAIKSMALRPWQEGAERKWDKAWYEPCAEPELAELMVRFTLSQDVNVLMPPGHLELFEMALTFAERFRPLEPEEIERLRALAESSQAIF